MSTSFEGWLDSWNGWGSQVFDPNAMTGHATLTISAVGTLIADGIFEGGSFVRGLRIAQKKRENDEALLLLLM